MAKKDIGALWQKTGGKGQYLSGYIELDGQKHPIVAFINTYKTEAKHPDYKIYPSEPSMRQSEKADREYDKKADAEAEAEMQAEGISPDDMPVF